LSLRHAIPVALIAALAACATEAPERTFSRDFVHDGVAWAAECRQTGVFGRTACMVAVDGFGADCQATTRHRDVLADLPATCGPVIDILRAGGLPEAVQVAEPEL